MEERKQIKLHRIPLKDFLDILESFYEVGADYVDIIGVPDEEQDSIGVAVKPEYFNKEDIEESTESPEENKLSDDNISNFISD